jgi:hypothetical protein
MGFTQRASCRPYKNCYHGGRMANTPKGRNTRKNTARTVGTLRAANHPKMIFKSEHVTFTSHPHKGEPHGMRTVVALKNGKGMKRVETLDKRGKTVKVNSKALKPAEMREITSGNYVPGLWTDMGV